MFTPSLTTILSVVFLGYMANSMWNIVKLYIPPDCPAGEKTCITNLVSPESSVSLVVFTTAKSRPQAGNDLKFLTRLDVVADQSKEQTVKVALPRSVTKNGTLYLSVFACHPGLGDKLDMTDDTWWHGVINRPHTSYTLTRLTQHHIPEAETFNLLGGEEPQEKSKASVDRSRPVTHLRSKLIVSLMTDQVDMSLKQVPGELGHVMQLTKDRKQFLPILYIDELSMRLRDLVMVNATDKEAEVTLLYQPISMGKLRLFMQFNSALGSMHGMGFTEKDTDEVKGIFADTNLVLLLVTFGVSAVHLLFDFLAFKSDINFWRGKKSMEGLSRKTILWRAFSQSVIFLYLMDEETSLLVLIPAGVGAVIEMWKVTKALHVSISLSGLKFGEDSKVEANTAELDGVAMRYLSWVLYPLCIGGAVYSLIYTPHKSWYSWTIQTTVNGVYAFGFLFMLPQLFLNYKLKSVAHLPWRAFMYKAFNTFIDDLFAFIITMPTAHRVACFRDDVVFLIYLYQRYLYPVDPNRVDTSTMMDEEPSEYSKGSKKTN